MIEQRSEVDPDSAILEDPVNCLDKLEDVVGAVDEEAGDHAVLAGDILRSRVDINKATCASGGHRSFKQPGDVFPKLGSEKRFAE